MAKGKKTPGLSEADMQDIDAMCGWGDSVADKCFSDPIHCGRKVPHLDQAIREEHAGERDYMDDD